MAEVNLGPSAGAGPGPETTSKKEGEVPPEVMGIIMGYSGSAAIDDDLFKRPFEILFRTEDIENRKSLRDFANALKQVDLPETVLNNIERLELLAAEKSEEGAAAVGSAELPIKLDPKKLMNVNDTLKNILDGFYLNTLNLVQVTQILNCIHLIPYQNMRTAFVDKFYEKMRGADTRTIEEVGNSIKDEGVRSLYFMKYAYEKIYDRGSSEPWQRIDLIPDKIQKSKVLRDIILSNFRNDLFPENRPGINKESILREACATFRARLRLVESEEIRSDMIYQAFFSTFNNFSHTWTSNRIQEALDFVDLAPLQRTKEEILAHFMKGYRTNSISEYELKQALAKIKDEKTLSNVVVLMIRDLWVENYDEKFLNLIKTLLAPIKNKELLKLPYEELGSLQLKAAQSYGGIYNSPERMIKILSQMVPGHQKQVLIHELANYYQTRGENPVQKITEAITDEALRQEVLTVLEKNKKA